MKTIGKLRWRFAIAATVVLVMSSFLLLSLNSPRTRLKRNITDGQRTLIPTNTTTSVDSTTGWKFFHNTVFGYSLRYPNDWNLYNPANPDNNTLDIMCFGKGNTICPLTISVLSGNSWEREKRLLGLTLSSPTGTEEIFFAGVAGFKRTGWFGEDFDPNGSDKETIVLLEKNGKVYKIWFHEQLGCQANEQEVKCKKDLTALFKQILASFRFTP